VRKYKVGKKNLPDPNMKIWGFEKEISRNLGHFFHEKSFVYMSNFGESSANNKSLGMNTTKHQKFMTRSSPSIWKVAFTAECPTKLSL
jgi:hypothetical protein